MLRLCQGNPSVRDAIRKQLEYSLEKPEPPQGFATQLAHFCDTNLFRDICRQADQKKLQPFLDEYYYHYNFRPLTRQELREPPYVLTRLPMFEEFAEWIKKENKRRLFGPIEQVIRKHPEVYETNNDANIEAFLKDTHTRSWLPNRLAQIAADRLLQPETASGSMDIRDLFTNPRDYSINWRNFLATRNLKD